MAKKIKEVNLKRLTEFGAMLEKELPDTVYAVIAYVPGSTMVPIVTNIKGSDLLQEFLVFASESQPKQPS